jgi:Bifunctional DNA primase/polymerase, N-terminal
LTTQRSIYLAPTGLGNVHPVGLAHVDWRGRGGYVVAPPSRHTSGHPYQWLPGRGLDVPVAEVPAVLLTQLERRRPLRPAGPVAPPVLSDGPCDRYARAALAEELARVAAARSASATGNCGSRLATSTTWSRSAPSTTAKSTTGCFRPPNAADSWPRSPARPAALSRPAARSAWPIPAAPPTQPAKNAPVSRRRCGRLANRPMRGGDGLGRRRPPGRLTLFGGWARAAAKQSPRPPTTHRKEFLDG